MTSDALAAANMISGDLAFYRMMDGLRAARARNNEAAEIAALQALVQRLANYSRYVEQQHNSLLADAKKLDAERLRQIDAQQQEVETQRQEIACLLREMSRMRKEISSLAYRKLGYEVESRQLVSRVAALEAENAKLRQASPTD